MRKSIIALVLLLTACTNPHPDPLSGKVGAYNIDLPYSVEQSNGHDLRARLSGGTIYIYFTSERAAVIYSNH